MVREGYDPVYGARPLKRYIGIETIIAKKLIAGDVYNGCTIVIDGKDENIEVLVK
ncbi:C-terminal, D2-small domain, of ClpB family protein [Clostridioides difficile DA00165]|nr:C-terminal, D2-small domain, of ClpB family protein [Clostridioides difficile DA00165]